MSSDDSFRRKGGERRNGEPVALKSLLALLADLEPLDDAFPSIPDPLPETLGL